MSWRQTITSRGLRAAPSYWERYRQMSDKPAESKAELLDYLRQMHEIRNFEDTVYKLLREAPSRARRTSTRGRRPWR